jgi:hypothetical protein
VVNTSVWGHTWSACRELLVLYCVDVSKVKWGIWRHRTGSNISFFLSHRSVFPGANLTHFTHFHTTPIQGQDLAQREFTPRKTQTFCVEWRWICATMGGATSICRKSIRFWVTKRKFKKRFHRPGISSYIPRYKAGTRRVSYLVFIFTLFKRCDNRKKLSFMYKITMLRKVCVLILISPSFLSFLSFVLMLMFSFSIFLFYS